MLTRDHASLDRASGLILPGVGAFAEGMRRLNSHAIPDKLVALARAGKPLLGICLGYQMLMRSSTEHGTCAGLGLIDQEVVKLPVTARLPHIGWSRVHSATRGTHTPRLLAGLDGELFYFVHSYGVLTPGPTVVAGLSEYAGCQMSALLELDNVFGTQFHPERSGDAGLQLLRNFTNLCR